MESELSKQTSSSSRSCGSCNRHFSNYNEFTIHYFRCPYTCVCEKEIQNECEYWQHFMEKDYSTVLQCCICSTSFTQTVDLMDHIVEKHVSLVKYACQHCQEEFSSFSNLASHVSISRVDSHISCLTCNQVFKSKCALVKHENVNHTGIAASSCTKTFKPNAEHDQRLATENLTTRDISNTTNPETNNCRTDSPYFVPDLQQYHGPYHLQEDPRNFSAVYPHDNLEHVRRPLLERSQSFHPVLRPQPILLRYFHPDTIHDMKYNMSTYNMSLHSLDCAYRRLQHDLALDLARQCQQNLVQNGPPNLNHPLQHNSSDPWLNNSGHYMQDGRFQNPQSRQLVGSGNDSSQNGVGSLLQWNEENLIKFDSNDATNEKSLIQRWEQ